MKNMKRMKELERFLSMVCEKYEDDCKSCPYQKECNEYEQLENERKNGGREHE